MNVLVNLDKSAMPVRFKTALVAVCNYILVHPIVGLRKVVLFGSLARSAITVRSDIDICLVFEDTTDLRSVEICVFKSEIEIAAGSMDIDVVVCSVSTFTSSMLPVYQNMRRDGIVLLS